MPCVRGWPNVMLEIRSDLIETKAQQIIMASQLVSLLSRAVSKLKEK
jgi:predicted N-formylglutamate amidohydrolase